MYLGISGFPLQIVSCVKPSYPNNAKSVQLVGNAFYVFEQFKEMLDQTKSVQALDDLILLIFTAEAGLKILSFDCRPYRYFATSLAPKGWAGSRCVVMEPRVACQHVSAATPCGRTGRARR